MRLITLLAFVVLPALTGCGGEAQVPETFVRSDPWDKETLEVAATLPVQEGGRVMPLQSYAGFLMLGVNGKRSLRLASGEKLDEMGFLLDLLLYPEQAKDYPCIVVSNSDVLDMIGVPSRKRRDRYSYNEISAQREALERNAMQAGQREKRDLLDNQVLGLWRRLTSLDSALALGAPFHVQLNFPGTIEREVLGGAVPRGITFLLDKDWTRILSGLRDHYGALGLAADADTPEVEEAFRRVSEELLPAYQRQEPDAISRLNAAADAREVLGDEAQRRDYDLLWPGAGPAKAFLGNWGALIDGALSAPAIFPPKVPVSEEEQWLSPAYALAASLYGADVELGDSGGWLKSLEAMVEHRDDRQALRMELTQLRDGIEGQARERGEYGKIASEVRLFNMDLVMKTLVLFLLSFVVAAFSWLFTGSRWLRRTSLGASSAAVALVVTAVAWRSILRGRPPVLNLYDTILFITAVSTAACLVMEAINRKRVGLALTPILGAMGMFLAFRYEVKDAGMGGDTLGQLQAVLDTNFWLATHVTTITAGYGAGLVATLISVSWILCRLVGVRRGDGAFYRDITKMAYGAICFALLLSVVGTILGGVWANESWGRFWGWDPKENGALLICITQLILLHARLGGYVRQHGLHAISCLQGAVICFSWWGVNELDAGLHSYGRTEGVLFYLSIAYSLLAGIAALSGLAWLLERRRGSGAS